MWLVAEYATRQPQPTRKVLLYSPGQALISAYKPAPDRAPEMQTFDKAVLFLIDTQEPDGHWDSKKWGAEESFSGSNGDVALTALASYVFMLSGGQSGSEKLTVMSRARRGVEWLLARLNKDGRIEDELGKGEPAPAQLLTTLCLSKAAQMSKQNAFALSAAAAARYAIRKMPETGLGFGQAARSLEPRADITALAVFIYARAVESGVDLSKAEASSGAAPEPGNEDDTFVMQRQEDVEAQFRAGLKMLSVSQQPGIYSMTRMAAEPDWEATVCCLLMEGILFLPNNNQAMSYVFGDFDQATRTHTALKEHIYWGQAGEGFSALSLWLGTLAMSYLHRTQTQWQSWIDQIHTVLSAQQSADGGWDVAGADAKRGRVWRTALNALTLLRIDTLQSAVKPVQKAGR